MATTTTLKDVRQRIASKLTVASAPGDIIAVVRDHLRDLSGHDVSTAVNKLGKVARWLDFDVARVQTEPPSHASSSSRQRHQPKHYANAADKLNDDWDTVEELLRQERSINHVRLFAHLESRLRYARVLYSRALVVRRLICNE